VETGGVLFLDAGSIWSDQRRLSESPLLVGLGAGLRLGLATVIGAPVLRLDVGYGARGGTWEVSGGLGQRF
jgi:outer membrane translocation and assembly module TamA